MTPEILAIIMFVTTLCLLLFGFPVAFTLAGSALLFAFLGELLDIFKGMRILRYQDYDDAREAYSSIIAQKP